MRQRAERRPPAAPAGPPRGAAELWKPLPEVVGVGGGTALFVDGLFGGPAPTAAGGGGELIVGDRAEPLLGAGAAPPGRRGDGGYWWAIAPIGPEALGGAEAAEIELALRAPGPPQPLATLRLRSRAEPVAEAEGAGRHLRDGEGPSVAICMATYRPDPELLRRQINSIRAQTHERWICLISDDGSGPEAIGAIEAAVGGDPRFIVAAAERNRGFYANFERALGMVPTEAELVAFSDQDDYWYPHKLEALIDGLAPGSGLVYSDMRIVGEAGEPISDTYWSFRRNNHTDYASLVLANTVTGAASLFRRELLDDVLPFPPRHANAFHDHWIAQVAMTLGPISYVDRPLYDYVQHGDAALGYLSANGGGRYSGSILSRGRISLQRLRRRRFRLGWRVPYFKLYCRTALAATVLEMRCAGRASPEQLALLRTLQDPAEAARWLSRRSARDLWRTTETLGRERVMLSGLGWYGVHRTRQRASRR